MQTPWYVWTFGLLLPPLLAFVYSASVLGMYIGFYEWTLSEKWTSLAWRFALLMGAAVVVYSDRHANEFGSDLTDTSRIVMMVVQSALLWTLSAFFVVETRFEDVVGGPDPVARLEQQQQQQQHQNSRDDHPVLKDKIVLITGANAGIGKETARQMAALGASHIILACRSLQRGQEAMEELRQYQQQQQQQPLTTNSAKKMPTPQYSVLECDLGSFESVRKAVDALKKRQLDHNDIPQIDILILNAGVMMKDHVVTADGCESMMQANLLGHYLLTRLLLERNVIKITPKKSNNNYTPRVLHLTSSTYQICIQSHGGMDLDDLHCNKGKRPYSLFGQYSQSKLGNILFAKELARRYPSGQLISLAIHPGIVRTDVTRNMPFYLKYPNIWFGSMMQWLQKTVPQGTWCTIAGATLPVDANVMSSYELDQEQQQSHDDINDTAGETPEAVKENPNKKDSKANGHANGDKSHSMKPTKSIPNGSYLQNGKVRQTDPYTYLEPDARKLWDMSEKIVGLEQK